MKRAAVYVRVSTVDRSPMIPLPKPAVVSQSGICWAGLIGDEVAEGLRFAVMR